MTKQKNNIKGNKSKTVVGNKIGSHKCVEYWLVRGFTEEESREFIRHLNIPAVTTWGAKDLFIENDKLNTFCKNSHLLLGYHQLKDLQFRKKLLSLLPKSNKKLNSSNLKFGLYTSFYKAEKFIDYILI